MKRLDDLLDAATSRFRYDAGLRREIARELRSHLEDSIAASCADGMDEAQAEEAAVKAFGDPEEIAEKLWQANRRRVRRRAAAIAAIGVVLMPAGILAAGALITFFLDENIRPFAISMSILGAGLMYVLTRLLLPKTAVFGRAFLNWLPVAFGKCAATVVRNPWIWAPALAVVAMRVFNRLNAAWHSWDAIGFSSRLGFHLNAFSLWRSIHSRLSGVAPKSLGNWDWQLLYLVFLLVAVWTGRRLLTAAGLSPRHARRWHVALIVSASVLTFNWLAASLALWGSWSIHLDVFHNLIAAYLVFVTVFFASIPCQALIAALGLTIVLRRVRGEALEAAGILKTALAVVWPMMWLYLIATGGDIAGSLADQFARASQSPPAKWTLSISLLAHHFLLIATAFLPVIIVSEQCGLRRACVRFGDIVRNYLWRYVAFVALGALLLGLPDWLADAALRTADGNWPVYVGVTLEREVIQAALGLALTVMCFEFYLTRAGTEEPMAEEEASAQVQSEGTH